MMMIENAGFIDASNFKYQPDKAKETNYDKSLGWYATKRTLFGGRSVSILGEHRATFDLRKAQDTGSLAGSIGGMKFGNQVYENDSYYNNTWLEKQVKENRGSETLQANIDEFKDGARQGKVFASIRSSVKQANIYASSLPIEGLNYFGSGSLYRSGPGVLQGMAINLSWTKEPSDPDKTISLTLGIENLLITNFQLITPKATIAIGQIGMTGLRLTIEKNEVGKGLFLGMLKSADLTMKTLMTMLPNVLKLLPYAVLTMAEEFKGAKSHVYKDALGALMVNDF